jgi:hypothetical protein
MRFLSLQPQEKSGKEDEKMEIKCPACGRWINLDHAVFENYVGTVKCFSCSSMMEVKIKDRVLHESNLYLIPNKRLFSLREKEAVSMV